MTRWSELTGHSSGADYQRRFDAIAASGGDPHGEATFVAGLVTASARVLDAGCGTGRVGIRLAELGHDVVGIDVDASMLAVAAERAPGVPWVLADLVGLDLGSAGHHGMFDLVVLAGNVIPLLAPGTVDAAVAALAAHLDAGGLLVAGFGLDAAHLPAGCPVTPLGQYDDACTAAGLGLSARFGTWDGAAFDDDGYAVSVHVLERPA